MALNVPVPPFSGHALLVRELPAPTPRQSSLLSWGDLATGLWLADLVRTPQKGGDDRLGAGCSLPAGCAEADWSTPLPNQRRAVGFKPGSFGLRSVGLSRVVAFTWRRRSLTCALSSRRVALVGCCPPPICRMAHKQIYYSDKYFDEHYEYRWAGRTAYLCRGPGRAWAGTPARGENLGPRVGVEALRAGVGDGVRRSGQGPAGNRCCVGVGPPVWERAPLLVWRAAAARFRSLFPSVRGTRLERRRGRFWCRVAALKRRGRGPKRPRRGRTLTRKVRSLYKSAAVPKSFGLSGIQANAPHTHPQS